MSEKRIYITDENNGKELDLPVVAGTEGEPTLDINQLPKKLGYFTYDPGFVSTAACESGSGPAPL